MYIINKFIGCLTDPLITASAGVLLSLLVRMSGCKRLARALLALCVVWVWLWSTPYMSRKTGVLLEKEFLVDGCVPTIESYTNAEVIVLHGGSMGDDSRIGGCGEMWTSADRVWMSARLWKAGKAPVICVTGGDVKKTTAALLEGFGVPTNAVMFAEEPRNTEEEARFVAGAMSAGVERGCRCRVFVVTSAWHLKRTLMLYAKYAPNVEVIPVPCDFENTLEAKETSLLSAFLPQSEVLRRNSVALHEWVGIWGYRAKWSVVDD